MGPSSGSNSLHKQAGLGSPLGTTLHLQTNETLEVRQDAAVAPCLMPSTAAGIAKSGGHPEYT
jgi:hypothetical protein